MYVLHTHIHYVHRGPPQHRSMMESQAKRKREQALEESAKAAKAVGLGQSRVDTALVTDEEVVAARADAARDAYQAARTKKSAEAAARKSGGAGQKKPAMPSSKQSKAKSAQAASSSPKQSKKNKQNKAREASPTSSPARGFVARRPGTRSSPLQHASDDDEESSQADSPVPTPQASDTEEDEVHEVPSTWKPNDDIPPLQFGSTVGRDVMVKRNVWPNNKISKGALGWRATVSAERKGKKRLKNKTVEVPEIKLFNWWFPMSSPDIVPMSTW